MSEKKKPYGAVFTGIWLTDDSVADLLAFGREIGPAFGYEHADHVCVKYLPDQASMELVEHLIGEELELVVTGYAINDRVVIATLVYPDEVLVTRQFDQWPHAVLSRRACAKVGEIRDHVARGVLRLAEKPGPKLRGRFGWFKGATARFETRTES